MNNTMITEYVDMKTQALERALIDGEDVLTRYAVSNGCFRAYTEILLRDMLTADSIEEVKQSAERILAQITKRTKKALSPVE